MPTPGFLRKATGARKWGLAPSTIGIAVLTHGADGACPLFRAATRGHRDRAATHPIGPHVQNAIHGPCAKNARAFHSLNKFLRSRGKPGVTGEAVHAATSQAILDGGVRLEDVAVVTKNGCENQGSLPEGLDWA